MFLPGMVSRIPCGRRVKLPDLHPHGRGIVKFFYRCFTSRYFGLTLQRDIKFNMAFCP